MEIETSLKGLCEVSLVPADTDRRREGDFAVVGLPTTTGSGRRGERYPQSDIGVAGPPWVSGLDDVAETADRGGGESVSEMPAVPKVCGGGDNVLLWI